MICCSCCNVVGDDGCVAVVEDSVIVVVVDVVKFVEVVVDDGFIAVVAVAAAIVDVVDSFVASLLPKLPLPFFLLFLERMKKEATDDFLKKSSQQVFEPLKKKSN